MSTAYVLRVTIFVPEAHIAAGNALALVLGESPADIATFGPARFEDADGNRYSVCSTAATHTFPGKAGTALVAPDHSPDADLALATQGQALVTIYDPEAPVQADPSRILAVIGDDPHAALAAAGVTLIPEDAP
jgi:hypothetical protein